MFSQGASPVSPSPLQVEEMERQMTATSGQRCCAQYGMFSPLGSLVRTLVESPQWWSPAVSLRWDAQTICSRRISYTERKAGSRSIESAPTLSVQDFPSSRLLFRLVPSEHHTGETECGLLPTPTALDSGGGRMNQSLSPGAKERPTLALAARLGRLPFPQQVEMVGGTSRLNPLYVEEMMGFPLMWTALPFLSPGGDGNP